MAEPPSLDAAYALDSPDAVKDLYANWAEGYDTGFSIAQGYQLPRLVARAYASAGATGPVLDVGAGTGLVGEHLQHLGLGPIDALDLSAEMLEVARVKAIYRDLVTGDIFDAGLRLGPYAGLVSAGTFTLGHVGPDGIDPLLRFMASGATCVLSINAQHFESAGFAAKLDGLGDRITGLTHTDVRIYDDRADADHRDDIARIIAFRTR